MARDNDGNIGRRKRLIVLVVLGAGWAVTLPLGEQFGPVTNARFALGALFQIVVLGIICAVARGVTRSVYNRRVLAGIAIVIAAQCALFASAAVLDLDVAIARTLQIGMWSLASALLAVFLERRFWPMAAGAFIAFAIAVADPSLRSIAAAAAAIGITANMALVGPSSKKPT
jgi:hypothetical protein